MHSVPRPRPPRPDTDGEFDRGALRCVAQGVAHEVSDHLPQLSLVAQHGGALAGAAVEPGSVMVRLRSLACVSTTASWASSCRSTGFCAAAAARRAGPAAAGPPPWSPSALLRFRSGPWRWRHPPGWTGRHAGTARRSPRMVTSGVRSSWEASAAKRRIRSSDAIRAAKAVSMCASMALRELPSRPTSVLGFSISTRRDRSPAAMAAAVFSTRASGRKDREMLQVAIKKARTRVSSPTPTTTRMACSITESTGARGSPITTTAVRPLLSTTLSGDHPPVCAVRAADLVGRLMPRPGPRPRRCCGCPGAMPCRRRTDWAAAPA